MPGTILRGGLAALTLLAASGWLAGPIGVAWLWPASLAANLLHATAAAVLLAAPLALRVGHRAVAGLLVAHAVAFALWTPWWGSRAGLEAAPTGGRALSVVTWNLGASVASPEDAVAALRAADADVVALQELNPRVAAALEAELGQRYPHRALWPAGVPGRGLLSRFPIVEAEFLAMEGLRRHLVATLDVDGAPLRVVVVHLSPTAPALGPRDGSVRDALALARELALADSPGLMLGDFNLTESSAPYAALRREGLTDAFREAAAGPAFTWPLFGRYRRVPLPPFVRIDHVWRTDGLRTRAARVLPDGGSDHLGLTVTVELTDRR